MIAAAAGTIAAALRVLADLLAPRPCPLCTKHFVAIAGGVALIDVRVATDGLPWLADWTECQAVRLTELDDGTYDLQLTCNYEQALITDLEQRAGGTP